MGRLPSQEITGAAMLTLAERLRILSHNAAVNHQDLVIRVGFAALL